MKHQTVKPRVKPLITLQTVMKLSWWSLLLLAILLTIKPAAADSSGVIDALKVCARTADDSARIACYEDLGKSVLAAEAQSNGDDGGESAVASEGDSSADTASTNTAEAESIEPAAEGSLPDSIGGREFAAAAGVEAESYRGKVKSCKRGLDRQWFYIFEGGQIWKQADNRKRSYKGGCDFEVTIVEDSFGYLMQVDGEERTTRINRFR
ncbi:MAG: hypothetical protein AAF431_18260 [Pseudomonadota bacterium]